MVMVGAGEGEEGMVGEEDTGVEAGSAAVGSEDEVMVGDGR